MRKLENISKVNDNSILLDHEESLNIVTAAPEWITIYSQILYNGTHYIKYVATGPGAVKCLVNGFVFSSRVIYNEDIRRVVGENYAILNDKPSMLQINIRSDNKGENFCFHALRVLSNIDVTCDICKAKKEPDMLTWIEIPTGPLTLGFTKCCSDNNLCMKKMQRNVFRNMSKYG